MNKQHTTNGRTAHADRRSIGRGTASGLIVLSLLLIPSIGTSQAPSPEEALSVAADYLRDQTWVVGDWYLGVDAVRMAGIAPQVVGEVATHREILSRIADSRGLSFYPGEDFGRVICDASADAQAPPTDCRFSHGTRAMLNLAVVSSDVERGIVRVRVFSAVVGRVATRSEGQLRTAFNSMTADLEIEYDRTGAPRMAEGQRVMVATGTGFTGIDQIVGATLRK